MLHNENNNSDNLDLHSPTKLTPILCKFKASTWLNLPKSYQRKTKELINNIAAGKPYACLGGVKVKCNHLLVRFRVGKNHRLVFLRRKNHHEFLLFNRQEYEKNFHRIN